ncbi:CLUMA_CG014004, isoform A [Clunio marinus]|uniref:RanBP-type and C3HC4-type zinc finger-containing protein 1 n=1 Tax=Clunio marinus TaxID=568069 RepID=A0A1J1IMG1_9DIPT|nr:CLUMA_CG014004, isoform A [Clunio marinus]
MNFSTADRPRCMLRDEKYNRQKRRFRRQYDHEINEYDDTNWYWNMSHQYNGNLTNDGKKPHSKHSKNVYNSSQRSHSSNGFQSFFRWFKKDEKLRAVNDIKYPREITSSTDTFDLDNEKRIKKNGRRKLKTYDSNDQLSPPSSPRFSRVLSQSSSCDSVFSTASSFAFVPPVKYLRNRNQKQPETSHVETFQKKSKTRDQTRESDRARELNLRRKYQLYADSSDAETNNNTLRVNNLNNRYQDLSLPSPIRSANLPDSVKLQDLNVIKHRRTNSDASKDNKSGSYVHVKGKRKAPLPPQIPRTLSPKSSWRRKKRPAPKPPISRSNTEEAVASSSSLLDDKEIKSLIERTSRSLSQTFSISSTSSSITSDMERRSYISPYLKIREDRKLTDEQKRSLIEQVSKNKKREDTPTVEAKGSLSDIFTIERGQLVYQGNESPKLPPKEDNPVTPSSPISPRPWFKRQSNSSVKDGGSLQLKSLEKKKGKSNEKDLPELGYSRNSFFGGASRFNIFGRIIEDSRKKERDSEKRKSQIGMPNISELDREAAEIIQQRHDLNKEKNEAHFLRSTTSHVVENEAANDVDVRPKSTKDLISKFEAETSVVNKITLNSAFIARKEFFGEHKDTSLISNRKEEEVEVKSKTSIPKSPPTTPKSSKLPLLIKETNDVRKQNDLMGLWTCPYCTLNNPNWKIICEACEKIKPYDKRFCVESGELIKNRNLSPKNNRKDIKSDREEMDKKQELVMKYFHPPLANGLSKSASETVIAKASKRKSPSPSRNSGSPLMNVKKNLFKSPSDNRETSIDVIEEETSVLNDKNDDNIVIMTATPTITSIPNHDKKNEIERKVTPNLNEVRSARLAKFNLFSNFKKNNSDVNANTNRKQSPEKKFPDKLDFSDPIALEQEKERLREKIRKMNAKALAEKYPVMKTIQLKEEENQTKVNESLLLPPLPSYTDQTKLGAIRKVFKNSPGNRRASMEKENNIEIVLNRAEIIVDSKEKSERISSSVQTSLDSKKPRRNDEIIPTVISDLIKPQDSPLTSQQQEEVEEISDQLKSKDGIESFRANLRTKTINQTNTLAINKILRNLETAIAEGKFDEAAQLATDLAKMKVSLSVTRQKERPRSDVDSNEKVIRVNVKVDDETRNVLMKVSMLMTVDDLYKNLESDLNISLHNREVLINEKQDGSLDVCVISSRLLKDNIIGRNKVVNNDSDDELQNEKVGEIEGAIGGKLKESPQLKIEEDGWECPLCTLINTPNRSACLACSTTRPASYKVPTKYQDIEYKLKVNEDLRTFFEMEKIEVRPQTQKNDLNRISANRKSSDIFNIFEEERNNKAENFIQLQTVAALNPNITKNKYRGVDNFKPNKSYIFSNLPDVRKPVITSVIYKSSQENTKETIKLNPNHYQQLVNMDLSDIAPNLETFECTICFIEIEAYAGAVLRECLHSFCKQCLESHIKYSEDAEIKCPFRDNQYSCQSSLQEREIRALVSKEEYEKHLTRSIRQAEHKIENTFHCKTPNCRGWCIFEDTSNIFRCPVCTIVNCLTCGAIHDGINCKQYQDMLNNDTDSESAKQTKEMLQDLIDKEEALNCPTCHIFLLKKWGCDWLKCSFCKTEICWVTRGPRWGPNGKGDTSGGCKCGVFGKKCSPKCNYCH